MKDTRLLTDHSAECFAVGAVADGDWSNPWGVTDGHRYLDAEGRKNNGGWRRWHRVICNDPKCPAILLIREDAIFDHFGRGL